MKNPLKKLFGSEEKEEIEVQGEQIESVCEDAAGDLANFCDIEKIGNKQ
jgi:hypothetical protein